MKAAIFDMDGTLVDSMYYWRTVGLEYLRTQGITPDDELRRQLFLTGVREVPRLVSERYQLTDSMEAIHDYLFARMVYHYKNNVRLKPGAAEYLEGLAQAGVPCMLATATGRELAIPLLERLGVAQFFDDAVCADELGMDKSSVEYFARLAERIGAPAGECVMFEDALYSIRNAVEAGMQVYAIEDATAEKHCEEIKRLASRYISSFDQLRQ